MEAKAELRYVRVAPRKARMVVDLIRGKNAEEAMTLLKFTPRHAARVVGKILNSALANATQKEMGDVDTLKISEAYVNVGPTMKRVRPRAMGRANTIHKRTSHITLVLGEDEHQVIQKQEKVVAEKANKKQGTSQKKAKSEPAEKDGEE